MRATTGSARREPIKPTAGSHEIVDLIYIEGKDWMRIKPIELRRLWKQRKRGLPSKFTAVCLRDYGDFTVSEIERWTTERREARCRP